MKDLCENYSSKIHNDRMINSKKYSNISRYVSAILQALQASHLNFKWVLI